MKKKKFTVEEVTIAKPVLKTEPMFNLVRVRSRGVVRNEIIYTGTKNNCIAERVKFERENPRFSSRVYTLKIVPARG